MHYVKTTLKTMKTNNTCLFRHHLLLCMLAVVLVFAPATSLRAAVASDTSRVAKANDTLRRTRPEYPGGTELLHKFFDANIHPDVSAAMGQSGKVVARFFVEKDGTLTNVEIVEHGTPEMDEEVMAVIRKMPRWNPGTRDGKPVRSRVRQTFHFHSKKGADWKPDMEKVAKVRRMKKEQEESVHADNLYVIDGRKASREEFDKLDASKIVSMKALKRKEAVKLYGKDGENGAIVVVTE